MKVSIITVCFNSAATIRDAILSVVGQEYYDVEYIIVDGGSTDGTLEIIAEYESYINKLVSEPDKGIYDAMNKGIIAATGDVVGILNSDDFYSDSRVITDVVEVMTGSKADAVFADLEIVDRLRPDRVVRRYSSAKFSLSRIRFGWMLPHPTFFVKRYCYCRYGLYKTNYRVSADFEMLTRLLWKHHVSYKRLPRSVVKMRQGGISTTGIWGRLHQNVEIVRACRENGLYTNVFFVFSKLPLKALEYFKERASTRLPLDY